MKKFHSPNYLLIQKLIIIQVLIWSAPSFVFSQPLADSIKMKGISLVGSKSISFYSEFSTIKSIGANWVVLMPYAFVSEKDGKVIFDHEKQWWGETTVGISKAIIQAKKEGLKVMVKPMLWIDHGKYTGDLQFDDFSKWLTFEETYEKYLTHFAQLGDSLGAELLCVGTEMKTFLQFRKNFFPGYIKMAKDSFNLKLTYAANWDNFRSVAFWEDLHYIGIDAYFPLSNKSNPTVDDIKRGWIQYKYDLKDLAEKENVPILFTEFGYRSVPFCCKEPWLSDTDEPVNEVCQQHALIALNEIFFNEPWFSGGFLWKWYDGPQNFPSKLKTGFSPQQKAAQKTIKNLYAN